jgi:hypothetical protein
MTPTLTWRKATSILGSVVSLAAFSACGGVDNTDLSTPYDPGSGVVIGDVPGGTRYPDLGECHAEICSSAQDACGPNGAADIVVDASGKVVDVICYGQDVSVAPVPVNQVASVEAKNNAVIVIDSAADGPDVVGDVTISGNNAIVYGGGPDVSVIGGTVSIEKNNAKIRGVRIQGDVTITKNNTKMLFCVIEGDLTISGNNTTIAECDVYGKVTVNGNNTVFVSDRFNGVDGVPGKNAKCDANRRFDDANADFVVQETELGGAVVCE